MNGSHHLLPVPGPTPHSRHSLVLLNTGEGKGKSTAALGVVLRALAQEWPVCVIQFMKSQSWMSGEERICERLGVTWIKGGDGFSWESADLGGSRGCAQAAWRLACEALAGGAFRLVVLDELTLPVAFGWLDADQVAEAIIHRNADVNVVITGRGAPRELTEIADVVTDMVKVRHPFDSGILARPGIDY